jgi:hypothetical protein
VSIVAVRVNNQRLTSTLPSTLDFAFFMLRMAAAARTELLDHELLGLPLLVLAGGVIAPLTAVARQSD